MRRTVATAVALALVACSGSSPAAVSSVPSAEPTSTRSPETPAPTPSPTPAPTPTPHFANVRFQFTVNVSAGDRADIERGTRIGLEQLRASFGEEIGDTVTIYAIASAAGEEHSVRFERASCCVGGSKAILGEYAAYYDVSNPGWDNRSLAGRDRSLQHRKIAVHELVHIWQDWSGCLITRDQRRPVPVWFFEGMAEYLAWRFMAAAGEVPLGVVDVEELRRRDEAKQGLTTLPLPSVEAQHPPANRGSELNGPSVTAVKMLADAHGARSLTDFCKRSVRADWRTVFAELFGRPVERFYEEYAAALARP